METPFWVKIGRERIGSCWRLPNPLSPEARGPIKMKMGLARQKPKDLQSLLPLPLSPSHYFETRKSRYSCSTTKTTSPAFSSQWRTRRTHGEQHISPLHFKADQIYSWCRALLLHLKHPLLFSTVYSLQPLFICEISTMDWKGFIC